MNMPSHRNPSDIRTACAPYNFVPLPEKVVSAVNDPEKELPDQDRFHTDRKTGYFEVELEVKSPLYVRCALPLADFLRSESEEEKKLPFRKRAKNKPDFFYTHDPKQPVIPGSSLRGMLRNLLEVVSYGKMEWVTEKQLFFRSVDTSSLGRHYRDRMANNVEAGFLRKEGNRYFIKICKCVRVFRTDLGGKIYEMQKNWETPRWRGKPHQHIPVWIRTNTNDTLAVEIAYEEKAEFREGRLVITGNMRVKDPRKTKKKEFVFLLPSKDNEEISIPEEMLERFHDDDQITQWQEKAFPRDKPRNNARQRDGFVMQNPGSPGDPVFFLREDGELTFFGRAQMFRLPYKMSPLDFVPGYCKAVKTLDLAEAIFGHAKGPDSGAKPGDKAYAYASRVFVTDAKSNEQEPWLQTSPIVPRILASPKPTAFQHYLVQPNPNDQRNLYHYGSRNTQTVIRGHKLYWHQGRGNSFSAAQWQAAISEEKKKLDDLPKDDTQHTQFKPVKPGTRFTFRIYFENLSEVELGALCWTLQPFGDESKEYCHSLGMGKPLGMGAARLHATLHITTRAKRYEKLFDKSGDWHTGEENAAVSLSNRVQLLELIHSFEKKLLDELKPDRACKRLFELRRIGMLLKMMEWPGYHPALPAEKNNLVITTADGKTRPNTRYMTIRLPVGNTHENEYKQRPVLPDPAAFGELTGDAVPTAEPISDPGATDSSQKRHPLEQKISQHSRQHRAPRQAAAKKALEVSPEARAMLKSVERQRQLAEAASQTAYSNGEVEKKAAVIKNPDGSLRVALPRLKDKVFPLKPKLQFSRANADAKIRVRVIVDKNNAITHVEEL